ncbi:MAG TPA: hypothetical protein VMU68_10710 [Acidimicrobiales bacterium]|nr:hypothetical protein [Acidimicrobiales bacterium]
MRSTRYGGIQGTVVVVPEVPGTVDGTVGVVVGTAGMHHSSCAAITPVRVVAVADAGVVIVTGMITPSVK